MRAAANGTRVLLELCIKLLCELEAKLFIILDLVLVCLIRFDIDCEENIKSDLHRLGWDQQKSRT